MSPQASDSWVFCSCPWGGGETATWEHFWYSFELVLSCPGEEEGSLCQEGGGQSILVPSGERGLVLTTCLQPCTHGVPALPWRFVCRASAAQAAHVLLSNSAGTKKQSVGGGLENLSAASAGA